MDINKLTVGEMAANEPKAIDIFRESGIDFCCNGKDNLCEALREKDMSVVQFTAKLDTLKAEAARAGESTPDFQKMQPQELAKYIVETHHAFLFKTLPETYALFMKVLRVHGARHPELYKVFELFGVLKAELDQHLIREETILFPKITDKSDADTETAKLLEEIETEHENAGRLMDKIRLVNYNYTLPSDACASYKTLYESMMKIEDDIHLHIHLENNILFK